MDSETQAACSECFASGTPPYYAEWRESFALAAILVHAVIMVVSILPYLLYARHPMMQGRDPHLLILVAIGAAATVHTAVREYIGESNYPCYSHILMTFVSNAFLIATLLVRGIRLLTLHRYQRRAQDLLSSHESEISRTQSREEVRVRLPSDGFSEAFETPKLQPQAGSAAMLEMTPLSLHEQRNISKSSATFATLSAITTRGALDIGSAIASSSRGAGDPHVYQATPVTVVRSRSVPSSPTHTLTRHTAAVQQNYTTDSSCCAYCCFDWVVLDVLRLHKPTGQLGIWAIIAVIVGIPNIMRAAKQPSLYFSTATGCYYNDTDTAAAFGMAVLFIMLHGLLLLYVRRYPDAFALQTEIIFIFFIGVAGSVSLAVLRAIPVVKTVLAPTYAVSTAALAAVVVAFFMPTWRAMREGRRVTAIATATVAVPSQPDAVGVVGMEATRLQVWKPVIDEHVSPITPSSGSSRPQPHFKDPKVDAAAFPGSNLLLNDRKSYKFAAHLLSLTGSAHGTNAIEPAQTKFAALLSRSAYRFSREDYDLLAVMLCSSRVGQRHFREYLMKEWCVENLLFLVEAAGFAEHCERAWKLFAQLADPKSKQTDLRQQRLLLKLESEVGNVMSHYAKVMTRFVLPTAELPVNVSATVRKGIEDRFARFKTCWDDFCSTLQNTSHVDMNSCCLQSVPLQDLFSLAEREILSMLACGPTLRFTTTADYLAFQRECMPHVVEDPRPPEVPSPTQPRLTQPEKHLFMHSVRPYE